MFVKENPDRKKKKNNSSHLRCSIETLFFKKLPNINRMDGKTPVLESLFNSKYCEIFKSMYFEEHLPTAGSENVFMNLRKIKKYS